MFRFIFLLFMSVMLINSSFASKGDELASTYPQAKVAFLDVTKLLLGLANGPEPAEANDNGFLLEYLPDLASHLTNYDSLRDQDAHKLFLELTQALLRVKRLMYIDFLLSKSVEIDSIPEDIFSRDLCMVFSLARGKEVRHQDSSHTIETYLRFLRQYNVTKQDLKPCINQCLIELYAEQHLMKNFHQTANLGADLDWSSLDHFKRDRALTESSLREYKPQLEQLFSFSIQSIKPDWLLPVESADGSPKPARVQYVAACRFEDFEAMTKFPLQYTLLSAEYIYKRSLLYLSICVTHNQYGEDALFVPNGSHILYPDFILCQISAKQSEVSSMRAPAVKLGKREEASAVSVKGGSLAQMETKPAQAAVSASSSEGRQVEVLEQKLEKQQAVTKMFVERLKASETEKAHLKAAQDKLESDLKVAQASIQQLVEDQKASKAEVERQTETYCRLVDTMRKLAARVKELETSLGDVTQESERLSKASSVKDQALEQMKLRNASLEKDLSNIRKSFDECSATAQKEKTDLQARLTEVSAHNAKVLKANEELSAQNKILSLGLEETTKNIEVQTTQNQGLQARVNEVEQALASLQQTSRLEIEQLKAELAQARQVQQSQALQLTMSNGALHKTILFAEQLRAQVLALDMQRVAAETRTVAAENLARYYLANPVEALADVPIAFVRTDEATIFRTLGRVMADYSSALNESTMEELGEAEPAPELSEAVAADKSE
jgi:hypothetical protein